MKSIWNNARRLTVWLACALFMSVFAHAVQAKDLNGYYEADDGGAYFLRQIGDKVYWFGEDTKGAYANVLSGRVSGNKITARWWDVPKGKTKGLGEMTLEIQDDGETLVKLSSTSTFGTKTWKKAYIHQELVKGVPTFLGAPPELRSRPAGYSGGEQNLTGAWQGNDYAVYYVREIPNEGMRGSEVVWVAENSLWGGPGGYAQPAFTHVFTGKKINGVITGEWVDLPKGKATGSGSMSLKLASQQELIVNPGTAGIYATSLWRSLQNNLRGFADLHTHPMVNLGFGGKLVHGGTDVGSLLTADADCNRNVRAKSIDHALGSDKGTHGGYGLFDNQCGDVLRHAIVEAFEEKNHSFKAPDHAVGYPSFKDWPRWNDITHQKMWVDWIRRSYDGGQRVMVALAVNNLTIAAGIAGPGDGPTDDKASADLQIAETRKFVARHDDFMEVAYSPADLRRIIASNKMAIVLGVEIDNIGNFNTVSNLNESKIETEVQRLFDEGVRYIFPVHLINNQFGGTAVYQDVFNLSNYHVNGKWWDLQCSTKDERISYRFKVEGFDFELAGVKATKLGIGITTSPTDPPECKGLGHKNTVGVTALGQKAIQMMMKRGMLIDVDHMSLLAVESTLQQAEAVPGGYPLVSGHNGLRVEVGNENSRTSDQLVRLGQLGGMFGLGSDGVKSADYLGNYIHASKRIGPGRVAFGTDLNGLVKGPMPRLLADINKPGPLNPKDCPDIYNAVFPESKTGDKTWDYCFTGVAHYGMLADFLKDMYSMPQGDYLNTHIMENAEIFAQMWEKALANGKGA